MIERHVLLTDSPIGRRLLEDWTGSLAAFSAVRPPPPAVAQPARKTARFEPA